MSLRLKAFELGTTTFPSKVVEYATHGLLILTTPSSDVPAVLGEAGARYLLEETPENLAGVLANIVENRRESIRTARAGREAVQRRCDPRVVGPAVLELLQGSAVPKMSAG